jgi:hypothetical protein
VRFLKADLRQRYHHRDLSSERWSPAQANHLRTHHISYDAIPRLRAGLALTVAGWIRSFAVVMMLVAAVTNDHASRQ